MLVWSMGDGTLLASVSYCWGRSSVCKHRGCNVSSGRDLWCRQVGSSSRELYGASMRIAGAGELLGEQGPSGVWHYGLDKGVRSHAVGHACGCTE